MHYFGKVFKQYEKQTPIQYIVELKGGTDAAEDGGKRRKHKAALRAK